MYKLINNKCYFCGKEENNKLKNVLIFAVGKEHLIGWYKYEIKKKELGFFNNLFSNDCNKYILVFMKVNFIVLLYSYQMT